MSWLLVVPCVAALGCQNQPTGADAKPTTTQAAAPGSGAPQASAAAPAPKGPIPNGIGRPDADIAKVVNPKGEAPYAGPKATVRGTVRIKGDAPPATSFSFPAGKCGEAAATYGKLFRVGLEGAAADVLVAVTGYSGFVPAREEAAKITIHGCAFGRRTMALTYGQRIEVANIDKIESYMPYVDGAPKKAVLVAVPGGAPVKLYAFEPGHYMLRDELPNPFLTADVYVLAYATHAVTGLDGQYEIPGVPVGEVRVSAFLPSIDKVVEQRVTLKEGDNTIDLNLEFDAKKDDPEVKKKAAAEKKATDEKGSPDKGEKK
ncbi:hypothetical protein [Polyangium sp. y55x31]|uniref:hypothetical protein n=1 Tax=Polyangium sp. y55x31 TaxID=3042688 RepID=UPI002482B490|nr:hypothetical protein [Polyangium sp. y55x31]MDI1475669.1 hypothetical protein [Polyangium sp. y55x31]